MSDQIWMGIISGLLVVVGYFLKSLYTKVDQVPSDIAVIKAKVLIMSQDLKRLLALDRTVVILERDLKAAFRQIDELKEKVQ